MTYAMSTLFLVAAVSSAWFVPGVRAPRSRHSAPGSSRPPEPQSLLREGEVAHGTWVP
jgi:hypothetical protein